jgi:hypothetical protein
MIYGRCKIRDFTFRLANIYTGPLWNTHRWRHYIEELRKEERGTIRYDTRRKGENNDSGHAANEK